MGGPPAGHVVVAGAGFHELAHRRRQCASGSPATAARVWDKSGGMSDPEIFGPYAPVARLAALPEPATASAGEDARGGDSRAPTESRLSGPWAAVQAILCGGNNLFPLPCALT